MSSTMYSFITMALLVATAAGNLHNMDMLKNLGNTLNMMNANSAKVMTNKNDEGSFSPCTPTDPKFSLTWTPKDIKLGETLSVSFDMTPVMDLTSGTVDVEVYIPDYEQPIYQTTQDFNCGLVHKLFPNMCPFKKGKEIKVSGLKVPIKQEYPLPEGAFTIKATIKDQKGTKFMCMKGTINIVSDYDYNGYDY